MVVNFSARHPRAESFVKRHTGDLITRIVQEQKDIVRKHIIEQIKSGKSPASSALELVGRIDLSKGKRVGGIIGLSGGWDQDGKPFGQIAWVEGMRSELSGSGDMSNYFNRTRRDKRYDSIVRKAMESGKPIPKADIERIVGKYSDSLLKLRGETIARNESLNALRAGRHEGYMQLADSGKVDPKAISRTWSSAHDKRTRHNHLLLDGQVVKGLDAHFVTADGSLLDYPGDSSLGAKASDTIQCRCIVLYKVDRRRARE